MARLLIMAGWLLAAVLALFLRMDGLSKRPFHADEATGAHITAERMSGEGGHFDPGHYHGPLLGDVAAWACRMRGEQGWREMRKETLRMVAVTAGVCVVLLPLFWRRRLGDPACLAMAGLLCVSPLMTYYSRMFIHEMLLVLAGAAFLACFAGKRQHPVAAGVFLGLMFAVKETFVISLLAWGGALVAVQVWSGRWRNVSGVMRSLRDQVRPLAAMAAAACVVSLLFYTRGFTHPIGAWHAVKTFFVYETVAGHDKPWWWYLRWLGWPARHAGVWWLECVVLWVAAGVWIASLLPRMAARTGCFWLRFLGFSLCGHLLIYGWFPYKTPWLICLPWWHACALAAGCLLWLPRRSGRMAAVLAIGCGLMCLLFREARMACGRLAADSRNPYAYVPTRADAERLEGFLVALKERTGGDAIGVVGADYWPLPWYLRSISRTGYWTGVPPMLTELPFVLAMPERMEEVSVRLKDTHHGALPYGLRPEVSVALHVRNDLWRQWMEGKP